MSKKICVVGLGYVGLPLAHAFAKKFDVVGFDISKSRIAELERCYDRTLELTTEQLEDIKDVITYTCDIDVAKDCNVYIVTVPTPIDSMNNPDLTPLRDASLIVGSVLKENDIVIYESTVYPGVTEEVCVPYLEDRSGLVFNKDFFCGYSPERINPGDKEHTVTNILKITSGSTPEVATIVDDLYNAIIVAGTHKASSIRVAEAAKVIENTQRDVNIALINELAMIFDSMGIPTHDVIEAAGTKWNFIKLKPGLVGGHCIGVDPYYLTYKAEELGYKPNLILGARQINNGMGKYIAEKTVKLMIKERKHVCESNVLVLGFAFKEDCPDTRNTKVVDIITNLKEFGVNVSVFDPQMDEADEKHYPNIKFIKNPFGGKTTYDSVVVAVGHREFKMYSTMDYKALFAKDDKPVLVDVKGILKDYNWRL
ncbi:nucleotide sugar dehydrogenase [Francisella salina]|uniref:UDP-glucose dehydrogenase n=1 Tax=Francisella salina TaxID=573569 RepID=A0ABM5M902_FRAST|nr:nucleotide sugar dehydrogenase [Francisella salina]AEI35690.1 UDP-glucose dehydrogenase [Francisella salina]